ncbi:hypothetical protein [Williamsia sp. M5A3_1d]
MSFLPLLIVIQAFVLSTWSMVVLTAYLVTRDDDHAYESLDLTAANVAGERTR